MRVPGADVNPYLAIAAIIGCGNYGIKNKLELPFGPSIGDAAGGPKLPGNLLLAAEEMNKQDSIARLVFGDGFVDHFYATRVHEWGLYARRVTEWEVTRYMETV